MRMEGEEKKPSGVNKDIAQDSASSVDNEGERLHLIRVVGSKWVHSAVLVSMDFVRQQKWPLLCSTGIYYKSLWV